MSKSKYKVTKGLAQIVTTGEPVFVVGFTTRDKDAPQEQEDTAVVVRPVVTQNGVEYREEGFPVSQLETRFEAAKRTVEFESFLQGLREEAQNKRYALPASVQTALENNRKLNG